LTTAFYLGRRFPNTRITVLEAQSRAGGWIQTEAVDLGPLYGKVILEAGPRTLRPVSKPLLELVSILGLETHHLTHYLDKSPWAAI
jgi:protoporphyrinogen/coproporphyrinogen III oxidase